MNPGFIYNESGKNIFYTPGLGTLPQHYCGYIGKLGVEFTANSWMTPNCPPGWGGNALCTARIKYMLKIENGQLVRYSRNLTKGGAVERESFAKQLSSAIPEGGDGNPSMNSSVTEAPSIRKYPLDCGKQPSKELFVKCMKNI